MFKLYFGSVANLISTCLLAIFFIIFFKTIKQNPVDVKWKRMSILIFLLGVALSATGGIKDTASQKPAVTFGTVNIPFILLSGLGAVATILGIMALILKKGSPVHKNFFYSLSFIIIVKSVILEGLRIKDHFIK